MAELRGFSSRGDADLPPPGAPPYGPPGSSTAIQPDLSTSVIVMQGSSSGGSAPTTPGSVDGKPGSELPSGALSSKRLADPGAGEELHERHLPKDYRFPALLACCVFPPIGVLALILSVQVRRLLSAGDLPAARPRSTAALVLAGLAGVAFYVTVLTLGVRYTTGVYDPPAGQ